MASITVQICTTVPTPRPQAGHIVKLRAATTGQEIPQPTDSKGRATFPNMASAAYDIFVCDVYKMRFAYGGGDVIKYVPTSCPDL